MAILEQIAEKARKEERTEISGQEAFTLYDTYGFPLDLTEDFAEEKGLSVDRKGFEHAMEQQRTRARAARQDAASMQVQGGILSQIQVKSEFVGYNELVASAKVGVLIADGQTVEEVPEGQRCQLVLDRTPFYAESGGQVADRGMISSGQTQLKVENVQKGPNGHHIHEVYVQEGTIRTGDTVEAVVDRDFRLDVVKNHTATHLLHKALKETLGEHVNQAGSLVAPDRLRFDFSHIGSVSEKELQEIESRINEKIWANIPVETMIKSLEEAKKMGAMALFGEKYGDTVRVVGIGDYSLELCGGTHVERTAEIGLCKIVAESSIGSGVRRIDAVTGRNAFRYLSEQLNVLKKSAELVKAKTTEIPERIEMLQQTLKQVERENESLQAKLASIESRDLTERVEDVSGVPVLAASVQVPDMNRLRQVTDDLKAKLGEGVIVLGSAVGDKVHLVASVSPDLVKAGYHAGKIIKEVAAICGGGGGGRPDMAQAGGKNPDQLPQALAEVPAIITRIGQKES